MEGGASRIELNADAGIPDSHVDQRAGNASSEAVAIESQELSLATASIEPIVFKWLGCNTNTYCKDKDHSQDGLQT